MTACLLRFASQMRNQVTVGTVISILLHSLLAVRTTRSPGAASGEAAFVPQFAAPVLRLQYPSGDVAHRGSALIDELRRALAQPHYQRRRRDGQAWVGDTA